jgi:hypothetical protein
MGWRAKGWPVTDGPSPRQCVCLDRHYVQPPILPIIGSWGVYRGGIHKRDHREKTCVLVFCCELTLCRRIFSENILLKEEVLIIFLTQIEKNRI